MADCSYMSECDFYKGKLDITPVTAEFIKTTYCHKDFEDCGKHLSMSNKGSGWIKDEKDLAG